ncbi:MAG: c-type cytochrome [Pseudomonadota bacterium]
MPGRDTYKNSALPALGVSGLLLGTVFAVSSHDHGEADATVLATQIAQKEEALIAAMDDAKTAEGLAASAVEARDALEQRVATAVANGGDLTGLAPASTDPFVLGRPAHVDEIAAWDVDVLPDGRGLPQGRGDVWTGEEVFVEQCASCHGDFAEGVGNWPVLAGGLDTLADKDPVKTVGSYWPHLSTAWDYINRSMPFGAAGTLTADETYAIVAYILYSNDLVGDDFVLSDENFAEFEMYNANGFVIDDRSELEYSAWRGDPCMSNCKDMVEITMRATFLDVTPEGGGVSVMNHAAASDAPVFTQDGVVLQDIDASADQDAPTPALVTAPTGDAERGASLYEHCSGCHQIGEGAGDGIGPHLNGIFDRAAAQAEGYRYSDGLQRAADGGLIWDYTTLDAYIEDPRALVSQTRMSFAGVKQQRDRDDLLAYLRLFSADPQNIPEAAPTAVSIDHSVAPEVLAIVGDPAYGEYLSGECTSCHQASGAANGIPSITLWPTEDFVIAMHAYKEGVRLHPVMQMMAERLSDEEIAALAAYFQQLE